MLHPLSYPSTQSKHAGDLQHACCRRCCSIATWAHTVGLLLLMRHDSLAMRGLCHQSRPALRGCTAGSLTAFCACYSGSFGAQQAYGHLPGSLALLSQLHTAGNVQQLSPTTATSTAQELTVLPLSMLLLLQLLQVGKKNRSVGATLMNQDSSRSHSIFTITVERLQQGTGEVSVTSAAFTHAVMPCSAGELQPRPTPAARHRRGEQHSRRAAILCSTGGL